MRPISSTTRSNSDSSSPIEDRDITEAFTGKDHYEELIDRANSVPLVKVFKHYGIRLDQYNRKVTCPFKSHKNGRESTPSFVFYPDTNTYCCFGCRVGSYACDFVAEIDRCTKSQAAYKILELFESDIDEDTIYDKNNFSERLEIMLDFSNTVREFYQTYATKPAAVYVEAACKKYDMLNAKKKFNNEALARIVEEFKKYISLYKP